MSTLPILNALPDSSGYTLIDGNSVVNSGELEGGASRSRADVIGATATCDVRWTCGPALYAYLRAFYRTAITNGADSFQMNLIFDQSTPILYTVKFVPGTFKLDSTQGLTYILAGSLEVSPIPVNANFDNAVVDIFGAYGETGSTILATIAQFANLTVTML